MSVGQTYGPEKCQFRDSETGAEITQYTTAGTVNRTLYFTNPSYVCDGERAIFLSDRTGRNEMFSLQFKSGQITQLTELPGQSNVSNCLHPSRPELYFHNGELLCRVNLDTLKTEELLHTPEGFRLGLLNFAASPWLALQATEQLPGITRRMPNTPRSGNFRAEWFFAKPRVLIYRLNVDTGELDCVWGDTKLLTHVQISPTNPDILIFSSFAGYGDDRCYYLDLSRRVKSVPQPIFPESLHARGSHECFTRRGNLYIQWMEGDLERFGDHLLYNGFRMLAGVPTKDIASAPFKKHLLPERQKDLMHHFTMSRDETWGVHDRWLTAPSYEENLDWLTVFRHQDTDPQTVLVKLARHDTGTSDKSDLGPEVCLDAKDEHALYTSYVGGNAHVCEVRLTPFVEKLMKPPA